MADTVQRNLAESFYFDADQLQSMAQRFGPAYRAASPFPHVVIDDFVPEWLIDALLAEFPSPAGEVEWQHLSHRNEEKLALADDARMGPATRHVLSQWNSSTFVDFLEQLTGITGLIPDPHFVGGGLHQIQPGGFLGVHADFNVHKRLRLDRRLNALLYLNRDWKEEYGGHLQLWDRTMTRCEESVLPIAGRCVIFSTTDESFHGHPEPLACPPGMSRKSLALYYYSNGRPAAETSRSHSTLFRSTSPDGAGRRRVPAGRELVRGLTPPLALDGFRALRARVHGDRAQDNRVRGDQAGRAGRNGPGGG